MSAHAQPGEYEHEPIRGLPEELPDGEEILWQGSPSWRSLARRAFHTRKVSIYLGALLLWSGLAASWEGGGLGAGLLAAAKLAPLALAAVGILAGVAWLNCRATVYTITDRRVVIRFGVALTLSVNLPFHSVESARVRCYADDTGDISLTVPGSGRIGYLLLWPFARAWHFGKRTQPMLRAVPDCRAVADMLAGALVAAAPGPEKPADTPVEERPLASAVA